MTLQCANPSCVTTSPRMIKGKFLGFDNRPKENSGNQVYWLCPSCTERFDLLFRDDSVAVVPKE